MTEYKYQNAIVRIHGNPNQEKLEAASVNFMKKVIRRKKGKK